MAQAANAPFPDQDWADTTRRWWEAWARAWSGTAHSGAAHVAEEPTPDILARLIEQGQQFLGLGESLLAAAGGGPGSLATEQWREAWRRLAESWERGMAAHAADPGFAFWSLPFDTWSRTMSSASVFPGDFLGSHKPEAWGGLADGLQRDLERFLSVPGLGYTREVQEQGQELGRLTIEYQRALQAYGATFRNLAVDSLERMTQRLTDRAARGEPITSLRALYDLWVDASEEAYFALVATDTYAESYGRMVNALMALKRHGRAMVDEVVGSMGLPTRHGLNTLQQRQQELRREVVALRRELESLKPRNRPGRASRAPRPKPRRRRSKEA